MESYENNYPSSEKPIESNINEDNASAPSVFPASVLWICAVSLRFAAAGSYASAVPESFPAHAATLPSDR